MPEADKPRVHRSGSHIIYAGRITKEGAADFEKVVLDACRELSNSQDAKSQGPKQQASKAKPTAPAPVATPTEKLADPAEASARIIKQNTDGSTGSALLHNKPTVDKRTVCATEEKCGKFSQSGAQKKDAISAPSLVTFHFNSGGGDLAAGMQMMDAVHETSKYFPTRCVSEGFVGSAATYPALACHERITGRHTLFLLHAPSKSGLSGQPTELHTYADNLDMWHAASTGVYLDQLSRENEENENGCLEAIGDYKAKDRLKWVKKIENNLKYESAEKGMSDQLEGTIPENTAQRRDVCFPDKVEPCWIFRGLVGKKLVDHFDKEHLYTLDSAPSSMKGVASKYAGVNRIDKVKQCINNN